MSSLIILLFSSSYQTKCFQHNSRGPSQRLLLISVKLRLSFRKHHRQNLLQITQLSHKISFFRMEFFHYITAGIVGVGPCKQKDGIDFGKQKKKHQNHDICHLFNFYLFMRVNIENVLFSLGALRYLHRRAVIQAPPPHPPNSLTHTKY